MKRLLWAIVIALLVTSLWGCGDKPFVIVNSCENSTATVYDGEGRVLAANLKYSDAPAVPKLDGYAGTRIEMVAILTSLTTNRKLGEVKHTLYLPYSRNSSGFNGFSPTGPDQLEPWTIRCPFSFER